MDHRDSDRRDRQPTDGEVTSMKYDLWRMRGRISRYSAAHHHSLFTTLYSLLLILFPSLALAAPLTFQELAFELVNILDLATITLIVFGLVAYFWGLSTNILHFGEDEKGEKKKAYFFWGLFILFVLVSIWGIIQLLQNTLFGNQAFSPSTGAQRSVFCDEFGNCGGAE